MTLTSFPLSNFNFAFADLVSLEVACLLLHSFATVLEGELLKGGRISYTTEDGINMGFYCSIQYGCWVWWKFNLESPY